MEYCSKKIRILMLITILSLIVILFSLINYKYNNYIYNYEPKDNSKFIINKVIIVGDSRMELIYDKSHVLNIPNYFIFDARSGGYIEWFKQDGLPYLTKILKKKKNYYKYHVVFNLGVNDVDYDVDLNERVRNYYKIYRNMIIQNKDVNFYFLSVNPIDENRIYDKFPSNIRTNEKIEDFNDYIYNRLNEDGFNNAKYCDSYNNLLFSIPDGLHYSDKTDQDIIDYINNYCIEFK